jgi:hypothetical protein
MYSSPWYRLALSLVLISVLVWFWTTRFDELAYHTWGKTTLINLGDATSFVDQREHLKPNSYVKVSGVLGTQAATLKGLRAGTLRFGPYQVRHLLGSKLYLEYDQERYHSSFNPFTHVEVEGRLTSFGPGGELQKVRDFFAQHYHRTIDDNAMLVVVDEKPHSEWRYIILFLLSIALVILSLYYSISGFRRPVSYRE